MYIPVIILCIGSEFYVHPRAITQHTHVVKINSFSVFIIHIAISRISVERNANNGMVFMGMRSLQMQAGTEHSS